MLPYLKQGCPALFGEELDKAAVHLFKNTKFQNTNMHFSCRNYENITSKW